MNYNEFNEYITEDLKIIGLRPDEDKKIKLYEFMNMVLEKNKVIRSSPFLCAFVCCF